MKKQSETLCFTCRRACGGCSWIDDFAPVRGWTADAIELKNDGIISDSFIVRVCPNYKNDSIKLTNKLLARLYGVTVGVASDNRSECIAYIFRKYGEAAKRHGIKLWHAGE